MIVGSIKENTTLEKRVSLTPESSKNIIGLGLKVCVEKGYALHLGIDDNEYKDIGVEIKASSKEVLNSSDLITKVNCPSDDEIGTLKDNTILIGMLNPSKNKNQIDKIIDKKIKPFSLELLPRITSCAYYNVIFFKCFFHHLCLLFLIFIRCFFCVSASSFHIFVLFYC